VMNVHGDVDSHIDALCHVSYDGTLYNGVRPDAVTSQGASELSIDDARNGIVGRGVLLDIPRLRGVAWVEPGDHVTAAELAAVGELPPGRPLLQETPAQAIARALLGDARRPGLLPLEVFQVGADRPAGARAAAEQAESDGEENPHHMRSIIAWPKPEQDTCFAPCIWRAKS